MRTLYDRMAGVLLDGFDIQHALNKRQSSILDGIQPLPVKRKNKFDSPSRIYRPEKMAGKKYTGERLRRLRSRNGIGNPRRITA